MHLDHGAWILFFHRGDELFMKRLVTRLAVVLVLLASGCHHAPAEERVRQAVTAAADAARNRDAGAFASIRARTSRRPTVNRTGRD
jgi:hypothetical protein